MAQTTKAYYASFGPYSEHVYFLLDERGKPIKDQKKRIVRVQVGSPFPDQTIPVRSVRDGHYFTVDSMKRLLPAES